MKAWPHQEYGIDQVNRRILGDGDKRWRVAVTTPTGGGKSLMQATSIQEIIRRGRKAAIYINRKSLVPQLLKTLRSTGIRTGAIAASFPEEEDLGADAQVCMMQTVNARIKRNWSLPKWHTVFVDEAHLQASGASEETLKKHFELGANVVGYSATPVDMAHVYQDGLIVAGKVSELRDCGALMWAHTFCPWEFDLSEIKRECNGEFSVGDLKKKIWNQRVVGPLREHLLIHNPDLRPTLSFAPGVEESLWLAKEYTASGIRAAHIDGEDVWVDGDYHKSSPDVRSQVIDDVRSGRIKVITNRFVMREGIDIPELYCLQLATPIGNTHSYVQIVGRVLRYHLSLADMGYVVIIDHGGNYTRHGSANANRDWLKFFLKNSRTIADERERMMREQKLPEPIICMKCGAARTSGPKCHICGFESHTGARKILTTSGELRLATGPSVVPIKREMRRNTERLWERMYHASKNKKGSKMTFAQLEAFFLQKYGHYPPRDIAYMPKYEIDFYARVADLDRDALYGKKSVYDESQIL